MKLTTALCFGSIATSTVLGFSSHAQMRAHALLKRQLSKRASQPTDCSRYHNVLPGEVCLGVLDGAVSGFTLQDLYKYNPDVNSDCTNLQTGQKLCTGFPKSGSSTPSKSTSNTKQANTSDTKVAADVSAGSDSSDGSDDDLEDCEDGEESGDDDGSDDDLEDCDEEDTADQEDSPTTSSDSTPSKSTASAVEDKKAAAPSSSKMVTQVKSSSSTPAATQSSSSDDSDKNNGGGSLTGDIFKGMSTFFEQNGVAGACGDKHSDSDFIVAMDSRLYQSDMKNSYQSNYCGRKLTIKNTDNGKTAQATVADECPTCSGKYYLDMSHALFTALEADMSKGMFNIEWSFDN